MIRDVLHLKKGLPMGPWQVYHLRKELLKLFQQFIH